MQLIDDRPHDCRCGACETSAVIRSRYSEPWKVVAMTEQRYGRASQVVPIGFGVHGADG